MQTVAGEPQPNWASPNCRIQSCHFQIFFSRLLLSCSSALFSFPLFWFFHNHFWENFFFLNSNFFRGKLFCAETFCNFFHRYDSKLATFINLTHHFWMLLYNEIRSVLKSKSLNSNWHFCLFKQSINVSTFSVVQRNLLFSVYYLTFLFGVSKHGVNVVGMKEGQHLLLSLWLSVSSLSISFILFLTSLPLFLQNYIK